MAAQDFILFPQATFIHYPNTNASNGRKLNDVDPSLDLFFTGDYDKWRALGEILLDEGGSREVERLQVGWMAAGNTIWFGRFHNPAGYWNTQFHHGTYLQTTIDRPGIHFFEDEGGLLPSHLTGVFVEGSRGDSARIINYAFALGAGPVMEDALEPLNILSPADDSHKLSTTARFSYSPGYSVGNELGVFSGHTLIPGKENTFTEDIQTTSGVFGNWQWGGMRLISEIFFVSNRVSYSTHSARGSFSNSYVQLEYEWRPDWTIYGRSEKTLGQEGDAYMALFPDFITQRNLAGFRFDIAPHHSLKIEVSHLHRQHDDFNKINMQWSAGYK